MSLTMVLYPFVASLTLDASSGNVVGGATGSVYAKADTTFTTPLAAVDASGNPVTLTSNANGVLPSFYVDGYTSVNWVSGSWVFPLVTSEPVEGPEGPAGVSVNGATATGDDLVFSLSNGSTTPPVKLPTGAGGSDAGVASYITTPGTETAAALSATYVHPFNLPNSDFDLIQKDSSKPEKVSWTAGNSVVARALGWAIITDKQWAGGADPTGVADSQPAIQAAINALRSGSKTGGTVYVPFGDFRLMAAVRIKTGVNLAGSGLGGNWVYKTMGRSRLFVDPAVDASAVINDGQASYDSTLGIKGLYIEGPTVGARPAIDVQGTTSATKRFIIRDCYVTNLNPTGQGIYFRNVQTSEILNCYISASQGAAIDFLDGFDNLISGNQIDTYKSTPETLMAEGIRLRGNSPHNIITDNFVFLCKTGIAVLGGYGNVISNNRWNTCEVGALLQNFSTAKAVSANVLNNNVFYDNGYKGTLKTAILVDGLASNNTIEGNTFFNDFAPNYQEIGIRLTANTSGNVVTGNAIDGSHITPIDDQNATGANFVSGNSRKGVFDGLMLKPHPDAPAQILTGRLDIVAPKATTVPLVLKGATGQTANLQEWRDGANAAVFRITPSGLAGTNDGTSYFNNPSTSGPNLRVATKGAGAVGTRVVASASQTADLSQWQDSSGVNYQRIDKAGRHIRKAGNAPALADLVDGEFVFWVDTAGTSAYITSRVAGVLRQSAAIPLA